jgi:hypothetical protein
VSEERDINWGAVKELYPDQYNLDPLEWRFKLYERFNWHTDAYYLDFLASHGRELLAAAEEVEPLRARSQLVDRLAWALEAVLVETATLPLTNVQRDALNALGEYAEAGGSLVQG